jgi:hypothetical protein
MGDVTFCAAEAVTKNKKLLPWCTGCFWQVSDLALETAVRNLVYSAEAPCILRIYTMPQLQLPFCLCLHVIFFRFRDEEDQNKKQRLLP